MAVTSLRARLVFPVDGPPIWDGFVEIVDGRIGAVSARPLAGAIDLGNVALLPALVNAHTHLEFSGLAEPLGPAVPFTDWLKAVIGSRRESPAQAAELSISQGRAECAATGTGLIGDIVTSAWSPDGVRGDGPHIVAFQESLGLRAERIEPEIARARLFLEGGGTDSAHLMRGLSPHAPYSVHPDLVGQLVKLAVEFEAPVAMHLAETPGELQLLEQGSGEFVDFLQTLGVWDSTAIPKGTRILDYLHQLARAPRGLVVHGNYLTESEIEFLSDQSQLTVIYCPRTHAYFQHPLHPWRELIRRGVSVALGTDSRASNPDLSLWNELLYLRRTFPQVHPASLLQLGTLAGARALGLEDSFGSLATGKVAAFAVADLPDSTASDPFELLFAATRVRRLGSATAWSDS